MKTLFTILKAIIFVVAMIGLGFLFTFVFLGMLGVMPHQWFPFFN